MVRVEAFFGNLYIKVGDSLEPLFLDVAHQGSFLHLDLPVFEAALQHLFGKVHRFGRFFTERLFDLYTRFRGDDDVQPVTLRSLGGSSDDGNRIAVVQFMFDRNILFVYFGRNTFTA